MPLQRYDNRSHSVKCPYCDTRIIKDRSAYAAHMVAEHGASDTEFLDVGKRGKNRYDRGRYEEGGVDEVFREEQELIWCGCGSTFNDRTSLITHLIFQHGAS